MNKAIYVTEPFLPPLEEYVDLLNKIWESKWLTNQGPFHQQLEKALCEYLGVPYISLFSNGTLALIAAIKYFNLEGEVITTPFSFVATTHAIRWAGLTPVFVDIEPTYFTLNPEKVEKAITSKTSAILAVHVYGNPSFTRELQNIAERYNLKLIYDAAHAFGVKKDNQSILLEGHLSVLSFHATKVFTTIEGGAIVSHSPEAKEHIDRLKNFGFVDETTIILEGFNAKMNEFQAAFGLLQLKYLSQIIEKRKQIAHFYYEQLRQLDGVTMLPEIPNVSHNYAYFPILIDKKKIGKTRDDIYQELKKYNIYTRRYFYPLISNLPMYRHYPGASADNLPVANLVANSVLCLPMSANLNLEDAYYIIDCLKKILLD